MTLYRKPMALVRNLARAGGEQLCTRLAELVRRARGDAGQPRA